MIVGDRRRRPVDMGDLPGATFALQDHRFHGLHVDRLAFVGAGGVGLRNHRELCLMRRVYVVDARRNSTSI